MELRNKHHVAKNILRDTLNPMTPAKLRNNHYVAKELRNKCPVVKEYPFSISWTYISCVLIEWQPRRRILSMDQPGDA